MSNEEMLEAASRFKQGLLAKATDGEYPDKDYQKDLSILSSDQRVYKMLPTIVRMNRSSSDFRREMQAEFQHYSDRRKFIKEQIDPIIAYLERINNGEDAFTHDPQVYDSGVRIGNGGFGTVFKYHHKLLDMDFAIKRFEPYFASDEEAIEGEKRFFREAKILFSLNHPNIVRVYDIGRYNGQPYIRMEYVEGTTIQDYIKQHGTVSFDRSKKPIIALLEGLSYAHERKVIHRDLKPKNFLVTNDGKFKIIDFGISAYIEAESHTKLTRTGEKVAGGAYTDPQLDNNPKLRDVRSDIYSVGAIWYYLLVGFAPMGGDIKEHLIQSGNATELQSNISLKCLSNRIEDRYKSCEELLSLLRPPKNSKSDDIHSGLENHITDITREAIFDYLIERESEETNTYIYRQAPSFQQPECVFYYSGRKNDLILLQKLYDLKNMPSKDSKSFEDEIIKHTINNPNDYQYGWVFYDSRLGLNSGDDETLLKFLCMMFHPIIRSEKSDWHGVLTDINKLLIEDGYEIYEREKISGKEVYSFRYIV